MATVEIGSTAAEAKRPKRRKIEASTVAAPADYAPPEIRSWCQRPRVALDLETHDPDLKAKGPGVRRGGYIVGIAIDAGLGPRYYPISHRRGPNADRATVLEWMRLEAATFEGELVGANIQYDLDFLAEVGVVFPKAKIRDVQIAEPLLNSNRFSFSLDSLGKQYLGQGKDAKLEELYGPDVMKKMAETHPAHAGAYAEQDVSMCLRMLPSQLKALEAENLMPLFEMECRLPQLLVRMRRQGVRVDLAKAREVRTILGLTERKAQARAKELVGREVDVWSAEDVAEAFDKLELTYPRTEKTDAPSFKKRWLEAHTSEIAKLVLAIRRAQKLSGTFIGSYILGDNINGRIHCEFNQLRSDDSGAVTGRFSSSHPNLQNIPVRDPEMGPLLRGLFLPEEGHEWGSADYSQIEPRLLAHYAYVTKFGGRSLPGAAEMVRQYRENAKADFHAMAANVTGKERKIAKSILLGTIYGAGAAKIADELGLSYAEGLRVITEFNTALPFLRQLSDFCSRRAKIKGQLITILGRHQRFPGGDRSYRALNHLCQGSAADIMKKSMVDCDAAGIFDVVIPHLTVHDELDVSVPRTAAGKEAFAEMCRIMERAVALEVPLLVEGGMGANWHEAHG